MPARHRQNSPKPGRHCAAGLLLAVMVLPGGTISGEAALAGQPDRAAPVATTVPDSAEEQEAAMIDFFTFSRPSKPNNYLACSDEYCPSAGYDLAAPLFDVPLAHVVEAWDALIAEQPRLEETGRSSDGWQREYVQRTRFLRFPDTITVRFVAEDGEAGGLPQTRVLLHSQAQLGYYDFGVNKQRVHGWLADLEQRLLLKKD